MPKRRATVRKQAPSDPLERDRVADTALGLAAETGWYDLRMRDLAARLGVGLNDLARRYPDPDAVADAVFARARDAMLAPQAPGFARLKPRDRVERAMLSWFAALAPHRRVAAEMLRAKLYPTHAHHWAKLPFHLSRLIWWLREAALLTATGPRRQAEEIALSAAFLAALAAWSLDADQARSRVLLKRLLDGAERMLGWDRR